MTRGPVSEKEIALVFTGDEYFEGLPTITAALKKAQVKAGFFFTGRLYGNKQAKSLIKKLQSDGHYLGPHSDQHLLYNDWTRRDSLLVTKDSLLNDLERNYAKMKFLDLKNERKLFIPPFEWWNSEVASWCKEAGIELFSFTPGTSTNADYTYPEMGKSYKSNEVILSSLFDRGDNSLNGSIILIHVGTDPRRKEKLYDRLPEIIDKLRTRGYRLTRIDDLLD